MPISLPISSSCIYLSFHIYVIKTFWLFLPCAARLRRCWRYIIVEAASGSRGGRIKVRARVAEALDYPSPALLVTRDYLRLVQAFAQIGDRDLRRAILALVDRLAAQS